jgi:hypothetical protein
MLYSYKPGSKSATALATSLGIKTIRHKGSKFKGREDKLIINWGASEVPEEVNKCTVVNNADSVKLASNKLTFFRTVKDYVSVPDFTTDKEEAKAWFDDGIAVVVREKLTGNSGEGIVILDDDLPWDQYNHSNAKMYVKYVKKKDEYRIHVVDGAVIDKRRKALRSDFPKSRADFRVRNYDGGFIFARDGFEVPTCVEEEAVKAVLACGLDFGAVDVVWNNFHQKAYVLEVNTAPGLEGSTVDNYAAAFDEMFKDEGYRARIRAKQKAYKDHRSDNLASILERMREAMEQTHPAQEVAESTSVMGGPVQNIWLGNASWNPE